MAGCLALRICREIFLQVVAAEDIDAHRREIALRLRGFLLELDNASGLVRVHDAKARCLIPRYLKDTDGRLRLRLLMLLEHPRIVHRVDVIAREDEHIVGIRHINEVKVLIDGICRAAIPVCSLFTRIRRQDKKPSVALIEIPCAARAEVLVQLKRTVLRQHADALNTGIHTVAQWKINDAVLPAKRNGGLCDALRQCAEAASLPACQNHCQAFNLSHRTFSPHGYRAVSPPCMQWLIDEVYGALVRHAMFLPI